MFLLVRLVFLWYLKTAKYSRWVGICLNITIKPLWKVKITKQEDKDTQEYTETVTQLINSQSNCNKWSYFVTIKQYTMSLLPSNISEILWNLRSTQKKDTTQCVEVENTDVYDISTASLVHPRVVHNPLIVNEPNSEMFLDVFIWKPSPVGASTSSPCFSAWRCPCSYKYS